MTHASLLSLTDPLIHDIEPYAQVYDTKVLAKALGITDGTGDTNLEGLYNSLTGEAGGPEEGAAASGATAAGEGEETGMGGGASAHEAGHDAFMTGVVFASLLERAAAAARAEQEGQDAAAAKAPARTGPPSLTHAEPWINKVFMRMSDIETFELRNFKQVRWGNCRRVCLTHDASAHPSISHPTVDANRSPTARASSTSGRSSRPTAPPPASSSTASSGTPSPRWARSRCARSCCRSFCVYVFRPDVTIPPRRWPLSTDPRAGQARGLRRLPQHVGAPARGGDAQVGQVGCVLHDVVVVAYHQNVSLLPFTNSSLSLNQFPQGAHRGPGPRLGQRPPRDHVLRGAPRPAGPHLVDWMD